MLDKDDETCWAAVAYAPKFNTSRPTRPAWVSGPAFAWTKLDSMGLRLEPTVTLLAWMAGPKVNESLDNLHPERCWPFLRVNLLSSPDNFPVGVCLGHIGFCLHQIGLILQKLHHGR